MQEYYETLWNVIYPFKSSSTAVFFFFTASNPFFASAPVAKVANLVRNVNDPRGHPEWPLLLTLRCHVQEPCIAESRCILECLLKSNILEVFFVSHPSISVVSKCKQVVWDQICSSAWQRQVWFLLVWHAFAEPPGFGAKMSGLTASTWTVPIPRWCFPCCRVDCPCPFDEDAYRGQTMVRPDDAFDETPVYVTVSAFIHGCSTLLNYYLSLCMTSHSPLFKEFLVLGRSTGQARVQGVWTAAVAASARNKGPALPQRYWLSNAPRWRPRQVMDWYLCVMYVCVFLSYLCTGLDSYW